jgi:mono/diheme cytochrome c family protein
VPRAGIGIAHRAGRQEVFFVKYVLSATLILGMTLAATGTASAQVEKGKEIFTVQKCTICHAVGGEGNKKGPLDGIGSKLSADEIREWITNAPEMAAKAKADRKPPMKPVTTLTKDELDALVAYVSSLKK